MRTGWVALAAIVVGCASGLGLTWYEFAHVRNDFDPPRPAAPQAPAKPQGEPKAVVVNGTEFDFKTLGHDKTGEHTFVVRNDGSGPLTLSVGGMSCGNCIQTAFLEATLQPGEKTDIKVTYATRKPGPNFRESLELRTNDPANKVLLLVIKGYVTHVARSSVDELVLGNISADKPTTASFRVYGYLSDRLEIVRHEYSNPDTADRFQASFRRLEPAELAEDKRARAGYEVTLEVKAGLPLGSLNQMMRISVQAEEAALLEVPIRGLVSSDIVLTGSRRLRSDTNLLVLGVVPRAEGIVVPIKLLVRGPYRDTVTPKISQVDPADALQARLGPVTRIAEGKIHEYELTVEVPKNAPTVNRLGTDQAKAGKIVIETTHPHVKQVQIEVRFATE